MKDVLVRAGSSLLAAVIGYIVLNLLAEGWGLAVKIGLAITLGVVAFVIAVWASKSTTPNVDESPVKPDDSINMASEVTGKKGVHIEKLDAHTKPGQQANVAYKIDGGDGPVIIKDVRLNATEDSK